MPQNDSDLSLSLSLLTNLPIRVGMVPVQHVPFRAIADFGYGEYMHLLGCFCADESQLSDITIGGLPNGLALIFSICTASPPFHMKLNRFCDLLFGEAPQEVGFDYLRFSSFRIGEDNWRDVVAVARARNGIQRASEADDGNPNNAATAALIRRRNELRKKVAERKRKADDEGITYVDLLSIYASAAKLPLATVMEMDAYQLLNQFKRLQLYDAYAIQINALMHGAKAEDIDIKHYVRKLDVDEND